MHYIFSKLRFASISPKYYRLISNPINFFINFIEYLPIKPHFKFLYLYRYFYFLVVI